MTGADEDDDGGTVKAEVGSLSELEESLDPKPEAKASKPKVDLVREIVVEFAGKDYTLTSVVPTVNDHVEIAKLCGQKSNPVPFGLLPPDGQMLIRYIALITKCVKNKPKWLDDVLKGHLAEPIFTIGSEVARHHEEWFQAQAGVDPLGELKPIVAIKNRLGAGVPAS